MSEMTPERAQRAFMRVSGYMDLDLYDLALESLEPVEASGRFAAECRFWRGEMFRARDEYAAALPYFEEVLRIEPGHVGATVSAGWCLKRLARLAEAMLLYAEAVKQHPDVAVLHYNKACYLSLLGEAGSAIEAFDRAIELEPEFREMARTEADFDPIRAMTAFQERLGPAQEEHAPDE